MIALADAVPAIVEQAAERTRATERGVIAVRVHRIFDVQAGPSSRHDDMLFAAVYQDGVLVKMHVISQKIGGKDTDKNAKSQIEQKYEHPAPTDVFKRPYDPKFLSDYTYEIVDPRTVRFKARVRDAAHGDGTFTLDGNANVVSVTYAPAALPQYSTKGTITDARAAVLADYWATTSETQQYSGHYMVFGGHASTSLSFSAFQRYPTVTAAIAAVTGAAF